MLVLFLFFPFSLVWAGAITDDDNFGSGEDPENSGLQEITDYYDNLIFGEEPENSGLQEATTQMPTMAITTTATTVQSSMNTGNKLVSYPTLYKGCLMYSISWRLRL